MNLQKWGLRKRAMTLLEVLIALAVLSTVLLPAGMFLIEYFKGSNSLSEYHQMMNILEEKMETALSLPFDAIPLGVSKNVRLGGEEDEQGKYSRILDLRPIQIGNGAASFELEVEMIPLEFSVVADSTTGRMERVRAENSYKRLILRAAWGDSSSKNLDLVAYKADL